MKGYIGRPLKFIAFLSLGLLFLWFASRGVKWKEFLDCFGSINYWWIALSLVLAWFGVLFRAWRWKILIKPLGYSVKLIDCYHAVTIAYLANFAFPRIGEVTRCAVLNRNDKVPFDSLIGTVITERISDLFMLIILIITVFFVKMNFFGSFITNTIFHPTIDKLIGFFHSLWILTLAMGLLMIAFVVLLFLFKHSIKKVAMAQKIAVLLKGC